MKLADIVAFLPADGEPLLLNLVETVGRYRALTDEESALVEELVRREKRRGPRSTHKWTETEDRELIRLQFQPRGIAEMAVRIGVSESAVWSRLQAIRHPHKRRAPRRDVGA